MEVQALSPEIIQDVIPPSHISIPASEIDKTFSSTTTDLISAPLGARVLHHTDDFFASSSNLINPRAPITKPGVFVDTGAWYDGWETRRHNAHPPDHVTIRLGPAAGIVHGVEIDTAFFTGNYAEEIEVLGTYATTGTKDDADAAVISDNYSGWSTILARRKCDPSQRHAWMVEKEVEGKAFTHVRLHMFPDGGIARFRLYGRAVPVWPQDLAEEVELSAAVNGGVAVGVSDQHFGKGANLLLPGRGENMGDGWETKRSRDRGHIDWVVVKLGARGVVKRVLVDTLHFRGNFPRGVRVEALDVGDEEEGSGKQVDAKDDRWVEILGVQSCAKDKEHVYVDGEGGLKEVKDKAFTHVKMIIEPDGGVKRFRVFGTRV